MVLSEPEGVISGVGGELGNERGGVCITINWAANKEGETDEQMQSMMGGADFFFLF